jgi:hypothetical protein
MIKGHISKAADVYALGMLMWELYTGEATAVYYACTVFTSFCTSSLVS